MRVLRSRNIKAWGIDRREGPWTDHVGSVTDGPFIHEALHGADTVVHCATLHKPHILQHTKQDFVDVNVTGTLKVLEACVKQGVRTLIFTSTTSVFGHAVPRSEEKLREAAGPVWISEDVEPVPRNIYGATKLSAEHLCALFHRESGLNVVILRTSRFFLEEDDDETVAAQYPPLNLRVNELLYRRADIADMVEAHILAIDAAPRLGLATFIISAPPPFSLDDCAELKTDVSAVVARYTGPAFAQAFSKHGLKMFPVLDRIYDSRKAVLELGWKPQWTFSSAVKGLAEAPEGTDPKQLEMLITSKLAVAVGCKAY
uniref:NAD-dependent epimerase/dehydratase domain-containing protein n=1 Tax=Chromera velia CCMP2878 TaxID=1169474 RepID=A0A0G4GNX1_9ALVE|eukprot:Cvel_22744.t1-p1 / transcript=Cvel_22744.t1 / gene=Cvel_22744 / organism=Chromera_velia_CCMP2878 / gene_product=Uncharacterized protein y4nG, putative / transcript_product=Uncharacterized protein y4nG, putative / location=Cvel_scaffold2269:14805-15746(+) / protein_length=314 / sequence_SO=supercontig / SO=protein_coding / is_pseudo=false